MPALYCPKRQCFPQPQCWVICNVTIIRLISSPGLLEMSLNLAFLLTANPKITFWPCPAPVGEKFPHHLAKTRRKRSTNSPFGQTCKHTDSRSRHRVVRAAIAPSGCKSTANLSGCTYAKPQHFPQKINCSSPNIVQTKVSCYSQAQQPEVRVRCVCCRMYMEETAVLSPLSSPSRSPSRITIPLPYVTVPRGQATLGQRWSQLWEYSHISASHVSLCFPNTLKG